MNNTSTVSSIDLHNNSEEIMGERIVLPYLKAIDVFYECLNLNENLKLAYQNFENLKQYSLIQIDGDLNNCESDILIHTALDKLAGKLYFTVKNKNTISHILFDNTTKEFNVLLNEQYRSDYLNILSPKIKDSTTNISQVNILNILNSITLPEVWKSITLNHVIKNRADANNLHLENQINDNRYPMVSKSFTLIKEDNKEENKLDEMGLFASTYNPAHTTVFPEDIESLKRVSPVKNGRIPTSF